MLDEMRRELSFHPDVEFIYRDAENSSERQIEQLRELSELRPDLIIVSPNEADPLTPVVDEIFRSGIPVIVTDRKTSSGLYHAYVGADNYEIGYMAGQYLAYQLAKRGRISEVTGLPGSSATIERQKGLHDALKAYPDLVLGTQINGQWLIDTARSQAKQHANELASSDAVFAYNDQMALGTYQAMKQSLPENDTKIIGVDALPGEYNGLHFVAEKVLHASMLYPTGGKECIQAAMAILNNQPYQRENILKTLVVDSTNVQLMKLQAEKIINQQQDIDKQQQLFAEQRRVFSDQQRMLNILVISLVLAIVFGGIAFYSLKANWDKNKQLEWQNHEILGQQQRILEMTNEVEQATEAKINFFTNISHEFKTPLSLLLVPLEELMKHGKFTAEANRSLALIKKNALTLQHLVSQLIDLRRVGYENLRIKAKPQQLLVFCSEIVQTFRPLAQQRTIQLRLENELSDTVLWFDEDLMEKLLYNLLSNAFKFTAEGGEVIVRLCKPTDQGFLQIQVIDTGEGIAASDIPHLCEPFYQGQNHAHGSGIGLALCKEIVDLHRGQLEVTSEVGIGTTVNARFQLGDAHLHDDEKQRATSTTKGNAANDAQTLLLMLAADQAGQQQLPGDAANGDGERLKPHSVLIVEDHPDMRRFLAEKLAEHFEVVTAANATEGLSLAYESVPDLILSDVLMPGELGTSFVKKLKSDVRTKHIPVVLLTARGTEAQQLVGLGTLADAYLTKPFQLDYVLAVVNNLITNRQVLRQHFSTDVAELQLPAGSRPEDKRLLNELAAVVEENIGNSDLNVDYICAQLSVSRIQLYRKVKSLLDCSINDYILAKRLRKSKVLLQEGMPINQAAYETGFSSPAYFSTAFKNKYGVSPSTFKRDLAYAR